MPHVCGDEPYRTQCLCADCLVCPTYVGMNRYVDEYQAALERMPHVCGDEPEWLDAYLDSIRYAPRMWG